MLKADQYVRDGYGRVEPALARTKEAVQAVSWWEVVKTVMLHLATFSSIVITITALSYIGEIPGYLSTKDYDATERACRPDGSFDPGIFYDVYNDWSPTGFFQITLGFGELAFSTVKIIDIIWDVVVGRGGQAVLAGASYIIFSKCLLRIMERESVSYGTFEVIGFQTASASTIFKLTRDYLTNHGFRARLAVACIVISSIYVVAFPTLVSAMTGYSANSQAFVKDKSGALAPWSKYQAVQYIVHDAWRVGLTGQYLLTDTDEHNSDDNSLSSCSQASPSDDPTFNETSGEWEINGYTNIPQQCRLLWHVSECKCFHPCGPCGFNCPETTNTAIVP